MDTRHDSIQAMDASRNPPSAVSAVTGPIGVLGLAAGLWAMSGSSLSLGAQSLLSLVCCAAPMVLWAVLVEKVHRNPSTGLDLAHPRPLLDSIRDTRIKLIGLWSTWAIIAIFYWTVQEYRGANYRAYLSVLSLLAPALLALSIPYVLIVDRYLRVPRDGLWHMGQWAMGRWQRVDRGLVLDHARAWAIKAFFLAFMIGILPNMLGSVVSAPAEEVLANPAAFATWFVQAMFLVDVSLGTVGYILTLRPLDSHIRSANPYLLAWVAALACYPPFRLMGEEGPLNYRAHAQQWHVWFQNSDELLPVWGAILMALSGVYAWATVIFGIRFSNLTHRGILTNGPYRYFKHPAYLSKNLFWWFLYVPVLSTAGSEQALRNCLLLLTVNLIYLIRARTEERHLLADPAYRRYAAWIEEHGVLPVAARRIRAALGWFCARFRQRRPRVPETDPAGGHSAASGGSMLPPAARPRTDETVRAASPSPRLAWIVLGLAAAIALTVAAPRSGQMQTVRSILESFVKDEGIPGAVLAIGPAGGAPTFHAVGQADLEEGRPTTPDLRFRVASLAKPVTAAAILRLAETGALKLDDRLAEIFPEVSAAPDRRHRQITLRDLLRHSAGWDAERSFDPILDLPSAARELQTGRPENCRPIALRMLERSLDFSPGTRYAYSNLGYCWLGLVIERVAQQPYETFVREKVLAPLGVTGMRIGEGGAEPGTLVRHYVATAPLSGGLLPYAGAPNALSVLGPAGGWIGSAEEMFRFASRAPPSETTGKPPYVKGDSQFYGLGWRVWPGPDGPTLSHFGAMPGVYSLMLRTADDIVVVALFNKRPGDDWRAFHRLRRSLPEAFRRGGG